VSTGHQLNLSYGQQEGSALDSEGIRVKRVLGRPDYPCGTGDRCPRKQRRTPQIFYSFFVRSACRQQASRPQQRMRDPDVQRAGPEAYGVRAVQFRNLDPTALASSVTRPGPGRGLVRHCGTRSGRVPLLQQTSTAAAPDLLPSASRGRLVGLRPCRPIGLRIGGACRDSVTLDVFSCTMGARACLLAVAPLSWGTRPRQRRGNLVWLASRPGGAVAGVGWRGGRPGRGMAAARAGRPVGGVRRALFFPSRRHLNPCGGRPAGSPPSCSIRESRTPRELRQPGKRLLSRHQPSGELIGRGYGGGLESHTSVLGLRPLTLAGSTRGWPI